MANYLARKVAQNQPVIRTASYYEPSDPNKPNPLLLNFNNELVAFRKQLESTKTKLGGDRKVPYGRNFNVLFGIWNKYECRLDSVTFAGAVIETGQFVLKQGQHSLALHQCYSRYLSRFPSHDLTTFNSPESIESTFLLDGMYGVMAHYTYKALLGKAISQFRDAIERDFNADFCVEELFKLLVFLRALTQLVWPHECLAWVVLGGSAHMYEISVRLLELGGHSNRLLEFLHWASQIVELNLPLAMPEYLPWRTTLYAAVLDAYTQSNRSGEADLYFKRCSAKVKELSDLEELSDNPNDVTTSPYFIESSIRLGVFLFAKQVFELKKRRALLKQFKTRSLRDVSNQWPRNPVERTLDLLFQGSAAQMLGILKALTGTHRRVAQPSLPDVDYKLDIYNELFSAGSQLIAGGIGSSLESSKEKSLNGMLDNTDQHFMMSLAVTKGDGVDLISAMRFTYAAFNFENWETFDTLSNLLIGYIGSKVDFIGYKKTLTILKMLKPLVATTIRVKKSRVQLQTEVDEDVEDKDEPVNAVEEVETETNAPSIPISNKAAYTLHNLHKLADTLLDCLDINPELLERDVLTDVTLLLWSRCKSVFQKFQTGSLLGDGARQFTRVENALQWVDLLDKTQRIMCWADIGYADPAATAECSLRLALLLEMVVDSSQRRDSIHEFMVRSQTQAELRSTGSRSLKPILEHNTMGQLERAYHVVTSGMASRGRREACISDVSMAPLEDIRKEHRPGLLANIYNDIYLELFLTGQRLQCKLRGSSGLPGKTPALLDAPSGNPLAKALSYIARAQVGHRTGLTAKDKTHLMQEACIALQRYQQTEYKVYEENIVDSAPNKNPNIPPPPLLIDRTDSTMTLKPRDWHSDQPVGWYAVFGHSVTVGNYKARLNDNLLTGTGVQQSSQLTEFNITGLQAGQRYVFAVAAYTPDGELIGDCIGSSCRPLVAMTPLPVVTAWGLLAQTAYQVGVYHVATKASQVLWGHFIENPITLEVDAKILDYRANDFTMVTNHLDPTKMENVSPILLRLFVVSIFVSVDIKVKESRFFPGALCEKGPAAERQVARLHECCHLLVAMETAGVLNEPPLAMQAALMCYGLLIPMVHYQVPSIPMVQVLLRVHCVLVELPASLRQRKQTAATDAVHHIVAVTTYHLARILRQWKQSGPARVVNEAGRKLLISMEKAASGLDTTEASGISLLPQEDAVDEPAAEEQEDKNFESKAKQKGKGKTKKSQQVSGVKVEVCDDPHVQTLQTAMLALLKLPSHPEELAGFEDPNILYAYIATLPSHLAMKEVLKFRRKPTYLEFFVQVLHKGLLEGKASLCLEWLDETSIWLDKRHQQLVPRDKASMLRQAGAAEAESKKYAAAVVTYTKADKPVEKLGKREEIQLAKDRSKRRNKLIAWHKKMNPGWSEAQRTEVVDKEAPAMETLSSLVPFMVQKADRLQHLRKICSVEHSYRAQMNGLHAQCLYEMFLTKLYDKNRVVIRKEASLRTTSNLDVNQFTIDAAGRPVIGWECSESATTSEYGRPYISNGFNVSSGMTEEDIDMDVLDAAAMAAIGQIAAPPTPELEASSMATTPRTYRSGASDGVTTTQTPSTAINEPLVTPEMEAAELKAMLTVVYKLLVRAVTLAGRGQHWTQLQNLGKILYNIHKSATMHCCSGPHPLLKIDELCLISIKAFAMCSYNVVDMLVALDGEFLALTTKALARGKGQFVHWETPLMGVERLEHGGAPLGFEIPLDDMSTVDNRWIKSIAVVTLEVLHRSFKWETLVDLGTRLNAASNNRYAEQIMPLIAHAQHELLDRLDINGGEVSQQPDIHFPVYSDYKAVIQFKDGFFSKPIDIPVYEDGQPQPTEEERAMQLVSVPLDISGCLDHLRTALDLSHYTARSLLFARRLLILYLASHQGTSCDILHTPGSRVSFIKGEEEIPSNTPPNLHNCNFELLSDIQSMPLRKSQSAVVISAYENAIELLKSTGEVGLVAQAMNELGNVFYHLRKTKSALHWWNSALDLITGTLNSLTAWRSSTFSLRPDVGIWGFLLGGVLASKIGQYILYKDIQARTEACLLAAMFFKKLFGCSLPHPSANRDYATYSIGAGCETNFLVPGIFLGSELHRADSRGVIAALHWTANELVRSTHYLPALPVLTLFEYFSSNVCRDLQRIYTSRLLRLESLIELHLFEEAVAVLFSMLSGERLPNPVSFGLRKMDARLLSVKFIPNKSLKDPANIRVLELLMDRTLSKNLADIIGPLLTCKLVIQQTNLLIALASTIYAIPDDIPLEIDGVATAQTDQSLATSPRSIKPRRGGPKTVDLLLRLATDAKSESEGEESDTEARVPLSTAHLLTGSSQPLTSGVIKGTLLMAAERNLQRLIKVLTSPSAYSKTSAELEILIQCRIQLATLISQRHHCSSAASMALSALNELKTAECIVNTNLVYTKSHEYENVQSRHKLDIRLWSNCRMAIIDSLLCQIKGVGVIGDINNLVRDIAECSDYCLEGMKEALNANNIDVLADLWYKYAVVGIKNGVATETTQNSLIKCISYLEGLPQLSRHAVQVKTGALVLLADIYGALEHGANDSTTRRLDMYTTVHKMLLNEILQLGQNIEEPLLHECLATPCNPLRNVFLDQFSLLNHVKLRIGHTLSVHYLCTVGSGSDKYKLTLSASILGTALSLCQSVGFRDSNLELEILMTSGKVQRQLNLLGLFSIKDTVSTLMSAIRLCMNTSNDLEILRQAYLEIGICLVDNASIIPYRYGIKESIGGGDNESIVSATSGSDVEGSKASSRPGSRTSEAKITGKHSDRALAKERERCRRGAWVAIRAAAAIGHSSCQRQRLVGATTISGQKLSSSAQMNLPEFMLLDLMLSHGTPNIIDIDGSPNSQNTDSYKCQLSWLHILTYTSLLNQFANTSSVAGLVSAQEDAKHGSLLHSVCSYYNDDTDQSELSHQIVNYPIYATQISLRIAHAHGFFASQLPEYIDQCLPTQQPVIISTLLDTISDQTSSLDAGITITSYGPMLMDPVKRPTADTAASGKVSMTKSPVVSTATDSQLCLQWYSLNMKDNIVLIYAVNHKPYQASKSDPAAYDVGVKFVSRKIVSVIHSKLVNLLNVAEVKSADVEKVERPSPSARVSKSRSSTKSSKSRTSKTKSATEVNPENELLEKLTQIMVLISRELSGKDDVASLPKLKPSLETLTSLEQTFSVSTGATLLSGQLQAWYLRLLLPDRPIESAERYSTPTT